MSQALQEFEMDFPVYEKGELVRANFNYPQLGPYTMIGLVVEPSPKGASGFVKVLMQSTNKIDFVPYSCLKKTSTG